MRGTRRDSHCSSRCRARAEADRRAHRQPGRRATGRLRTNDTARLRTRLASSNAGTRLAPDTHGIRRTRSGAKRSAAHTESAPPHTLTHSLSLTHSLTLIHSLIRGWRSHGTHSPCDSLLACHGTCFCRHFLPPLLLHSMFSTRSIPADHKDLVHDVSYDFYGKRFATCSSDQFVKVGNCSREHD